MNRINLIASYEFRLLFRDWTFRFLLAAGLCLVLTGHYMFQCHGWIGTWDIVALSSSVPLLGVYMLNFIQVVILFFSGMTFTNGNRKIDTVAVLYSRSVGNVGFVIGKILGTGLAILLFDAVVMIVLMIFHLLFSPAPLGLHYYIFYPLVLLVPSLVFWSGVVLWIKSSVAHQGMALLVMMVVFVLCFMAASKGFWIIDVFGHEIPNVFSDITGYEGLSFLLSQRLFILVVGSGFWCLGMTCWKRIPNRVRMKRQYTLAGVLIILISIVIPFGWWQYFRYDDARRIYYHECQRAWEDFPKSSIRSHDIRLVRDGVRIEVESDLLVFNASEDDMTGIVFYLNPGLEISELTLDNEFVKYDREGQVVIIHYVLPGTDSVRLRVIYKGKIDERVCYLDIPTEKYRSWKVDPEYLPYRVSRSFSYVGDEYTLLTPECLWYPVTESPVRLSNRVPRDVQFIRFSLKVREEKGKTIISQGRSHRGNGWVSFEGEHDYPGISLSIGDYERRSMRVDGVFFELYYFEGHDFFTERMSPDGLGIRRLMESPYYGDVAKWVGVPARVALVETPLTFWAYERTGSSGSEFVQAEIIFGPERGMGLYGIPFAPVNDWEPSSMIPDISLASFFWSRLKSDRNFFIDKFFGQPKLVERANKRNVKRMFSDYQYSIKSGRFPAINILFQGLKQKSFYFYGGTYVGVGGHGKQYLAENSFFDALRDRNMDFALREQIYELKAMELKRHIVSMITEDEWDSFISDFLGQNLYKNVDLEELCEDFQERYGEDLMNKFENIYHSKGMPFFSVKDVFLEKINGEWNDYMCRAKVWNRSSMDGLVTMYGYKRGMERMEKTFQVKAGECKEFNVRFSGEKLSKLFLLTNLSLNMPEEFEMVARTRETNDTLTGIFDIDTSCFINNESEIVVDNRDADFNTKNSKVETFLGHFFQDRKDIFTQISIYSKFAVWQNVISTCCYGDTIRDTRYISALGKGGKAEWCSDIPEDGVYEVWIYNPRQLLKVIEPVIYEYAQKYTIYADKEEEVEVNLFQEPQGWVLVGTYVFKKGDTKIILHDAVSTNESQVKQNKANMPYDRDKEVFPIIFADAVKWVRVNKKQIN